MDRGDRLGPLTGQPGPDPPTLDQVLVGSIERSRHPDLKAVFLMGTSRGSSLSPLSQTGLLTDDDRESGRNERDCPWPEGRMTTWRLNGTWLISP